MLFHAGSRIPIFVQSLISMSYLVFEIHLSKLNNNNNEKKKKIEVTFLNKSSADYVI